MKIARFSRNGSVGFGVVEGDALVDVTAARALADGIPGLLAPGPAALAEVRRAVAHGERIPQAGAELLAPIPRPPKFLAIGLNYADHVKEAGLEAPSFPVFFNKQTTCVVGPHDPIHRPRISNLLDYEGELGLVIGRRCRHVPADRARSSYVHPLYGLDGEVITDDFPKDHYHHRGLFWAWPHVRVGTEETDLWMLKGIRQQFERWLGREAMSTRQTPVIDSEANRFPSGLQLAQGNSPGAP